MIEKKGTCPGCGYLRANCMCGKKRNTSGEYVAYSNYTQFPQNDDYSTTARMNRTSSEERKIMDELIPIDKESMLNFIKRTDIAESKLIKYSYTHHLYGTKRVWSCHSSSRYCFICTLCQLLETNRAINYSLPEFCDLSKLNLRVNYDVDAQNLEGTPTISLD